MSRSAGHRASAIRVAKIPTAWVAHLPVETAEPRGLHKSHCRCGVASKSLGQRCWPSRGGEIMSMLQIAMMGKLPYTALEDGIFAHPAFAEGLNTLFMSMDK